MSETNPTKKPRGESRDTERLPVPVLLVAPVMLLINDITSCDIVMNMHEPYLKKHMGVKTKRKMLKSQHTPEHGTENIKTCYWTKRATHRS